MALSRIDLANPDNYLDGVPHHWLRELRNEQPVYWHEEQDGPGFWCITKYEDLRHVSRHPEIFSSWLGGTNIEDRDAESMNMLRAILLNMDPPQHVKFRRIVQRGFTPQQIAKQEPYLREVSARIVDKVAARGEAEFVEELAAEMPLQVICEMVGIPLAERKQIFDLSNKLIGFDDPEFNNSMEDAAAASGQIFAYAMELARKFKANPVDNLTSTLLHAEVDGEQLSEMEFCAFFLLLVLAGNETTRTVTTNGMRALIEHPDQLQILVDDPMKIPIAVEEFLRYDPAVINFRRTATQDTEIRGQRIRKGQKVVMWYPSANRDEEIFADPDRFDVTRNPNPHLAFGIGEHFCLGANLARMELVVIFEEMITRLKSPKLAAPPRRLRSNFINGTKEMRITFEPERGRPPR